MPPACLTSVMWISLQKVRFNNSTEYKIEQLIPMLFGWRFRFSTTQEPEPFTSGIHCPLRYAKVQSRNSCIAVSAARSSDKEVTYEREPFKIHHHSVFQKVPANQKCYASPLSSSWIAHHSRPSDASRGKHEPKPLATGLTNSRTLPGVTLPLRQRVGTGYPYSRMHLPIPAHSHDVVTVHAPYPLSLLA